MTSRKTWSSDEDKFLTDNYLNLTGGELCRRLERSIASIRGRVAKLGLEKFSKHPVKLGESYGRLLVVDKSSEKNADGKFPFLCRCECGNMTTVVGKDLSRGHTKSCGCLASEAIALRSKKPAGLTSFNYLYFVCKANAKRRKIDFSLSFADHTAIIQQACYYCGTVAPEFNKYAPSSKVCNQTRQLASIRANGIDRVDSNLGYSIENCVPCCRNCNFAKSDLTITDFLNHVRLILNFQEKKSQ